MKYFEVEFTVKPTTQDACDLLAAMAGDAGFETFEETETGMKGYVQQALFDQVLLDETLSDFPMQDVSISYDVQEADDQDWNAEWEAEGFEPIVVGDNDIVVHDGRHLPPTTQHPAVTIEIDAKLAFGTGNHETTRLMLTTLLDLKTPQSVLDCGTGTGILSICALKLGAREAVGYDIDEWSVDNARHNAVINRVDDRFTSLLGDASILDKVEGSFDLVTANINRNILLADMPQFCKKMAEGATLILSGFYTADNALLIEKAETLGLKLQTKKEDQDWACLVFSKS